MFNSHLSYALLLWGSAFTTLMSSIEKFQKRAVRAISFADFNSPSSHLFKSLGFLKLTDLFKLKVVSLMYHVEADLVPAALGSLFNKVNHSFGTRSVRSGLLAPPDFNTYTYGCKAFKTYGVKIFNQYKNHAIWQTSKSKIEFLRKLKQSFIDTY